MRCQFSAQVRVEISICRVSTILSSLKIQVPIGTSKIQNPPVFLAWLSFLSKQTPAVAMNPSPSLPIRQSILDKGSNVSGGICTAQGIAQTHKILCNHPFPAWMMHRQSRQIQQRDLGFHDQSVWRSGDIDHSNRCCSRRSCLLVPQLMKLFAGD